MHPDDIGQQVALGIADLRRARDKLLRVAEHEPRAAFHAARIEQEAQRLEVLWQAPDLGERQDERRQAA